MKAILVIDIPKGYGKITDNKATVNLKNWKLDTSLIVCNVPLKPMPQKKMAKHGEAFPQDMRLVERWKGYDMCIDEILGEQE